MRTFLLCLIALLLVPVDYNQIDQYHDRHDQTAYFVFHNGPFPLVDFNSATNADEPHEGAFKPGGTATYKVDRTLKLSGAVLATVTRRIVRRFSYDGRPGREPIYSYPTQSGVEIIPGDSISFSHFDMPSAKDAPSPMNPSPKDIPPGEYSLELAVSFLYHGDQRTYTAETQTFKVEAR